MIITLLAAFNLAAFLQSNPLAALLILGGGGWLLWSMGNSADASKSTVDLDAPRGGGRLPELVAVPRPLVPTVDDGLDAMQTLTKIHRANGEPEEAIAEFVRDQTAKIYTRRNR